MSDFVEVLVEATGNIETVPRVWLGDPVLGVGISEVKADTPDPAPGPVAQPPSEVQLSGPVDDLPIVPEVRDAVLAARAAAADETAPTEDDTHAVIDEFAKNAGIDLGEAKTKAEKVAVINNLLTPAGEEN